jgi:hypothetical protein
MVEDLVKAAKDRRWGRTIGALIVGTVIGAFIFSSLDISFFGGLFCAIVVWTWESKEVDRVKKIQNPWRDGDGK